MKQYDLLFLFLWFQYFINVADDDVERYLKLFTFLPEQEIASIMAKQNVSNISDISPSLFMLN